MILSHDSRQYFGYQLIWRVFILKWTTTPIWKLLFWEQGTCEVTQPLNWPSGICVISNWAYHEQFWGSKPRKTNKQQKKNRGSKSFHPKSTGPPVPPPIGPPAIHEPVAGMDKLIFIASYLERSFLQIQELAPLRQNGHLYISPIKPFLLSQFPSSNGSSWNSGTGFVLCGPQWAQARSTLAVGFSIHRVF